MDPVNLVSHPLAEGPSGSDTRPPEPSAIQPPPSDLAVDQAHASVPSAACNLEPKPKPLPFLLVSPIPIKVTPRFVPQADKGLIIGGVTAPMFSLARVLYALYTRIAHCIAIDPTNESRHLSYQIFRRAPTDSGAPCCCGSLLFRCNGRHCR